MNDAETTLPSAGELARTANRLRLNVLEMVVKAGGGHIGGSFSSMDFLTALYMHVLKPRSA